MTEARGCQEAILDLIIHITLQKSVVDRHHVPNGPGSLTAAKKFLLIRQIHDYLRNGFPMLYVLQCREVYSCQDTVWNSLLRTEKKEKPNFWEFCETQISMVGAQACCHAWADLWFFESILASSG